MTNKIKLGKEWEDRNKTFKDEIWMLGEKVGTQWLTIVRNQELILVRVVGKFIDFYHSFQYKRSLSLQ